MNTDTLHTLRFPIGEFTKQSSYSPAETAANILAIRELPSKLQQAVESLNDSQLDTPYREGGWTVRQVAHHLGDSHMNAFIRHRLTLTEDHPAIKAYDEAAWAELADAKLPVFISLGLLSALHERWATMLEALRPEQFTRTFEHPESGRWTLDESIAQYAWHGKHHVAHITELVKRMGW